MLVRVVLLLLPVPVLPLLLLVYQAGSSWLLC
jgi:hypothetical protein